MTHAYRIHCATYDQALGEMQLMYGDAAYRKAIISQEDIAVIRNDGSETVAIEWVIRPVESWSLRY